MNLEQGLSGVCVCARACTAPDSAAPGCNHIRNKQTNPFCPSFPIIQLHAAAVIGSQECGECLSKAILCGAPERIHQGNRCRVQWTPDSGCCCVRVVTSLCNAHPFCVVLCPPLMVAATQNYGLNSGHRDSFFKMQKSRVRSPLSVTITEVQHYI